jgi:hypothetical protein
MYSSPARCTSGSGITPTRPKMELVEALVLPRSCNLPSLCEGAVALRSLRVLVYLALGELRERLIGLPFLGESPLQQLRGLTQTKLRGPRLQRPVARDLVVLDRLGRREQTGIKSWHSLVFLHSLFPILSDTEDGRARLAPDWLADLAKHPFQTGYMFLRLLLVFQEGAFSFGFHSRSFGVVTYERRCLVGFGAA